MEWKERLDSKSEGHERFGFSLVPAGSLSPHRNASSRILERPLFLIVNLIPPYLPFPHEES